jgi:hypothetical protein
VRFPLLLLGHFMLAGCLSHSADAKSSTRAGRYAASAIGRTALNKDTAWSFLSATVPTHIYKHIYHTMAISPNSSIIRVSTNRTNHIYDACSCWRPQQFAQPRPHYSRKISSSDALTKIVIFHGNKAEAAAASRHINSRFPEAFQTWGFAVTTGTCQANIWRMRTQVFCRCRWNVLECCAAERASELGQPWESGCVSTRAD